MYWIFALRISHQEGDKTLISTRGGGLTRLDCVQEMERMESTDDMRCIVSPRFCLCRSSGEKPNVSINLGQ